MGSARARDAAVPRLLAPLILCGALDAAIAFLDTEPISSLTVPVDQTFAALADPTRVEIVVRLHRGSATVSELAEPYDMSLRAVLKHVQVLEAAGLVRTVKDGRVRRCELERRRLDEAERWMDDLRRRWERRLDRIETYIEREKKQ